VLLNQHLGPMHDKWLLHALAEAQSKQGSALASGDLEAAIRLRAANKTVRGYAGR